MSRRGPARILAVAVLAAAAGLSCSDPSSPSRETEISRERAIEIAQQQISFQPDSTDAEQTTSNARPVWRVTVRGRRPGQPPGLFETAIVEIDRRSGEVVSVART
jgi:hypothetical protein